MPRATKSRARYDKEQLLRALELFRSEPYGLTPQDALRQFADHEGQDDRAVLAGLYDHFAADPYKRDAGAYVRTAILGALRPVARPADVPLLERALFTYEFPPPGRVEGAAHLRAAALTALNEVDAELAGYHSARLLGDEYNSAMSGEPGVTAVRVLAGQGQALPLYACVTGPAGMRSEVVGECLRSLVRLPASLLPALVERYRDSRDEIVLVGLFDLLLAHEAGREHCGLLVRFLRETHLYDAYRYLVTVIVAGRHEELLREILALAKTERDRFKVKALGEALSLLAGRADVDAALHGLPQL